MKKAILPLILVSIFLSSCSKTEETKVEELSKSPLMGSWVYFGYINESLSGEVRDPGECETKDTYTFNEDGTYQYSHHSQGSSNLDCSQTSGESGTWEQISDNKLKFSFTDDEGPYSYESEFVISDGVLDLTVQEGSGVYIDKYRKK